MKLLLAITASERNNFSWDFISSLLELKAVTGATVTVSQGCYIDINRNKLLLEAIKGDYDYVCMIDSDMTFPKDAVDKLLKTMKEFDAKVGTGLYFKGSHPHDPVIYDLKDGFYEPITDWKEAREVDGCGMGFCLIHKDLFPVMFSFTKLNGRLLGEDITFCHLAKSKGHKIVLDPRVKIGHLRTLAINEEYIKCVS
jgi:hypothetical protein